MRTLGLEVEICAQIGRDLPPQSAVQTRCRRRDQFCLRGCGIGGRSPAEYAKLDVRTLVADNSWNAGIVLSSFVPPPTSLEKVEAVIYQDSIEQERAQS